MSGTRSGFPGAAKRAVFGLVLLAIAGVLLAVAWPELPDGSLEIRLPGRTGRGPSLGHVPALDHALAVGCFAAASLLYIASALILGDRFRHQLAALPAAGALAASSILAGLVMDRSSSDGLAIALAVSWIPVASGAVLLFGYAVEGVVQSTEGGPVPRRRKPKAPPLPPWRRRLLSALGLLGAAWAILLFVVSIVAHAEGRIMRLPFTGYALPGFPATAGTVAAVWLLAVAVAWLVVLLAGTRRSFAPLAMMPAAAVLGEGSLVLGAMSSDTGMAGILLGFAVVTAAAVAAGVVGRAAAASDRR